MLQTWWFEVPGFGELVSEKLGSFIQHMGPRHGSIEAWHCVAQHTHQFLKGSGANLGKEKWDNQASLLARVVELDLVGLDEEG
jgi:hypothetical protein